MKNDAYKHGKPDENDMLAKILRHECGNGETDEYIADQLEKESCRYIPHDQEFSEDLPIGEPDYFSTCEYTMIDPDEDAVDCQGS